MSLLGREVSAQFGVGTPYRGLDVRDQVWRAVLLRQDVLLPGFERVET
jgi:hypothetical protein